MKYENIDFSRNNLENIFANIDIYLVIQTNNVECMMKREDEARWGKQRAESAYESAYHSTFLKMLHGSILTAEEKKFAQSVADKAAKAMCDNEWKDLAIAKAKLESASAVVRIQIEKMNTLKKVKEDRSRMGG